MHRHIGMIDMDTGELVGGGIPVWVSGKTKSAYEDGWLAMNQHFLREFAACKDIGLEVYRVFLYLDARLSFKNVIQVPQKEIAEELQMRKQNVNRAIRKLENMGIIIRDKTAGRVSAWRLNPNVSWKGKTKDMRPAIEQHFQDTTRPKKLN